MKYLIIILLLTLSSCTGALIEFAAVESIKAIHNPVGKEVTGDEIDITKAQ